MAILDSMAVPQVVAGVTVAVPFAENALIFLPTTITTIAVHR